MDFKCLASSPQHKFSLPKPEEIEGAWAWRGQIKCPMCGSENLEETMVVAALNSKRDMDNIRRENRERTAAARSQATRAESDRRRSDPDIAIKSPDRTPSRFGQGVTVRKSVIEALKDKSPIQSNPNN